MGESTHYDRRVEELHSVLLPRNKKRTSLSHFTGPKHKLHIEFVENYIRSKGNVQQVSPDTVHEFCKSLKLGAIKISEAWRDEGVTFGGDSADSGGSYNDEDPEDPE